MLLPGGLTPEELLNNMRAEREFGEIERELEREQPFARPVDPIDSFRDVVGKYHADPIYALNLIEALGGFSAIAAMKPRPVPKDLNLASAWAIEISIGKNKPSKAKTKQPLSRQRLPYSATVQCWIDGGSDTFEPDWHATAFLRDPHRAALDMNKNTQDKATPLPMLSQEYRDWLSNDVIPIAQRDDMLIGFLCLKGAKGVGTHLFDSHVVLVPNEVIDDPKSTARAILMRPDSLIVPPRFFSATSTGKQFGGTYFRQARGVRPDTRMSGWQPGEFQFIR